METREASEITHKFLSKLLILQTQGCSVVFDELWKVNLVNSGRNNYTNQEAVTPKLHKRIKDQEQFRVQRLYLAIHEW